MERVNGLLCDSEYLDYLNKNHQAELHRIYCRHDLIHVLDTARIAYILNLEENRGVPKEVLYAAALLHDIGRWQQYETGIGHDVASKALAEGLLRRHGFDPAETAAILEAIGHHRDDSGSAPLTSLLYRADKLSRNCPSCASISTCKRFLKGEKPFLRY